jgi:hypothetical protein
MEKLTKNQKNILKIFYKLPKTKVVFNKKERNKLWSLTKSKQEIPKEYNLDNKCPALKLEIEKSYKNGNKIQSAIFSECVYAQTLSNMFGLNSFNDCRNNKIEFSTNINQILKEFSLLPRYSYSSENKILIQAGGHKSVDGALIENDNFYKIEFKETMAKSSEPDLPKYDEDGKIKLTEQFKQKYPQFVNMVEQHLDKNIFEYSGHNINDFTFESINYAVTTNYSLNKHADVCCTEDENGYLVMIPANHIQKWANVEGELRTAGRNHCKVWTPKTLKNIIKSLDGTIKNGIVKIPVENLEIRKKRGGNDEISGYKISSLFFVYKENVKLDKDVLTCNFDDIRQLIPTITAKIFFKNLNYDTLKSYYKF